VYAKKGVGGFLVGVMIDEVTLVVIFIYAHMCFINAWQWDGESEEE